MTPPRLIDVLAPRDDDAPALREGEPRDFALNLGAQTFSKLADGLADPKIVLASLLSAAGAPGLIIGALAPVREAGALLPQMAMAGFVKRSRLRKRIWAAGSALQGLAAAGIAASALVLDGWAAGLAALLCLAALSVARAACSLSHKDALARTVAKTRRGAVGGAAGSAAAAGTLAFGALLAAGILPQTREVVAGAVLAAGLCWAAAALLFVQLGEPPTDPEQAEAEPGPALDARPLLREPKLRRFVATRALLTATAIAPPYLVMLSAAESGGAALGALGPLVLASGAASILSSYAWGRAADRSSRQTLAASAGLATVTLAAAAAAGWITGGLGGPLGAAAAVFALQLAYAGVRLGRKTHLTDMAPDRDRAVWTAVANTAVGAVLLIGPAFGWLADIGGASVAVGLLALLCAVAIPSALTLDEVQDEAD